MYIGKVLTNANALAVNGVFPTGIWLNSMDLQGNNAFGVWVQANSASSGVIALRIIFEQSWRVPTTEGATDTAYAVPDAQPDVFSDITDNQVHQKAYFPIPMKFGRYKIIGLTGNASDVTLTMYTFIQELGRSYGA